MGYLNKLEYQDFLKTDFWITLSNEKKLSVGSLCEACGKTDNIQCHHKFYRKSWYATEMNDLIVLCAGCHIKTHQSLDLLKPKRLKQKPRRKPKSVTEAWSRKKHYFNNLRQQEKSISKEERRARFKKICDDMSRPELFLKRYPN